MGARIVKFDFIPKENEEIEAVVRIPKEDRSVLHGVVKDWHNKVVKDAVVKLFEVIGSGSSCTLKPITHTFTDEHGQFLFGPLLAHKKYAIKVWFDDVTIRELVITPEDDSKCDRNNADEDNCDCDENKDDEHNNCDHDRREAPRDKYRERRPDRRFYRDEEDEEE